MTKAQQAYANLVSGVGNLDFYLTPSEQRYITDALEPKKPLSKKVVSK